MDGQRIGTGYSQKRRPEAAIFIVISGVMPLHAIRVSVVVSAVLLEMQNLSWGW